MSYFRALGGPVPQPDIGIAVTDPMPPEDTSPAVTPGTVAPGAENLIGSAFNALASGIKTLAQGLPDQPTAKPTPTMTVPGFRPMPASSGSPITSFVLLAGIGGLAYYLWSKNK